MSALANPCGYDIFTGTHSSPYADSPERGMSEEARIGSRWIAEIASALRESISGGKLFQESFGSLENAFREASVEDWDGYGARPADRLAGRVTQEFLEHLPTTFPSPEVSIDPDGEVSLEWYREPRWVLSVSISRTGRLSYAALFGREKMHGTQYFESGIPQEILGMIRKLHSRKA